MSGDNFQKWLHNGRASTIAMFLVFVVYVTFQLLHIHDEVITNVFVTMAGIWIGNLGIAQGRKTQRIEEKVNRLQEVAITHHPDAAPAVEMDDQ